LRFGAYLFSFGAYLFSLRVYLTQIGSYLISSDKEETKKGSHLFSSDAYLFQLGSYLIPLGKRGNEKGKHQEQVASFPILVSGLPSFVRGPRTKVGSGAFGLVTSFQEQKLQDSANVRAPELQTFIHDIMKRL